MKSEIKIFYSKDWSLDPARDKAGYELLDTGDGEKLERFGKYTFVRPYEAAAWKKSLSEGQWSKADGRFITSKEAARSGWKIKNKIEKKWEMSYKGVKFFATPTSFRHLSFFPEQAVHWDFIEEKIIERQDVRRQKSPDVGRLQSLKFLNLFGYTGVASLFALRAGAEVTHVDASKLSITQAKENQKLNTELAEAPMRVIVDDVIKFLEREIKRGNKYDAVVMDPPKFGRGPKGEIWKLEENLPKLLSMVRKVLSDKPLFVILNSYAVDSSSLSLGYALEDAMKGLKGEVSSGELCLLEKSNKRTIPLSNTAIFC